MSFIPEKVGPTQTKRVPSTFPALNFSLCRAITFVKLAKWGFSHSDLSLSLCACERERESAMFGRVRPSSCPAESLERPPSKIFKDDSLSIYEATLMKLKLGSKRNLSPCSTEIGEIDAGSDSSSPESEPMNLQVNFASAGTSISPDSVASPPQEEVMAFDTDCSSDISSTSWSDYNSVGTSKQPRNTEVSVLYLFSKFKRAHDAISSSSGEAMTIDSAGVSPSSSGSRSINNTEQQLEQECISSLPASHICML